MGMTTKEAITLIECAATDLVGALSETENDSEAKQIQRYIDAYDMAISALRQQERFGEANKTLTLDDLRKMDGEPVWVEFQDGSGGCWGLVHITVFNHIVFANGLFCTVGKPYYGKTWMAYIQKPEEGKV